MQDTTQRPSDWLSIRDSLSEKNIWDHESNVSTPNMRISIDMSLIRSHLDLEVLPDSFLIRVAEVCRNKSFILRGSETDLSPFLNREADTDVRNSADVRELDSGLTLYCQTTFDRFPMRETLTRVQGIEFQLHRLANRSNANAFQQVNQFQWRLPDDVDSWDRFKKKIQSIRFLRSPETGFQIGIACPLLNAQAISSNPFRQCLQLGLDYIAIRTPPALLPEGHDLIAIAAEDNLEIIHQYRRELASLVSNERETSLMIQSGDQSGCQAGYQFLQGVQMLDATGRLLENLPQAEMEPPSQAIDTLSQSLLGRPTSTTSAPAGSSVSQIEKKLQAWNIETVLNEFSMEANAMAKGFVISGLQSHPE